jgi:hypothetical protein
MTNNETNQKSNPGTRPASSPTANPNPNGPIPARQLYIAAAIQQLWRKLQVASAAYDPADTDHGRASAGFSLIAVLEFLSVLFPQTPTLPSPLEVLLHALYDVDRGTRNPLFTRSKGRGRGPIQLGDALFRAMVAAAMTKRMQAAEISLEPAARDIERRLGELGYRRRTAIEHKQIAKWREKMNEGGIGDRGVERYRLALQLVQEMQPVEGTQFLLGSLAALYPSEFAKKAEQLGPRPPHPVRRP